MADSTTADRFKIERSDGDYYIGTAERRAFFGDSFFAATFPTENDAAKRCQGLLKAERHGRTFNVVPADA